ncbi:methyltransferase [Cumulibacter soli]|uniref:methyltransferase n=1 Tax=Cumulibacter soli TaxID=2546344 RepID=UPI001067B01F|nr:methyltransferase [Cumulibacter soli]
MQRLAILEPLDPIAAEARRDIGSALGAALHSATTDPAAMRPLWSVFSRGEPVPAAQLRQVLGEDVVTHAVRTELLIAVDVGEDEPWLRGSVCIVAAEVGGELRWVASDFGWYDDDPDAVSGPGEASATLLAAIPEGNYRRVLEVGSGAGAVITHLASLHDADCVASDINPRALAFTELTAALNAQPGVQTLASDFADQIHERFDLVVCNPPFILGRPSGHTIFRDSADGTGHATLGTDFAALLRPGGLAVYLTNWEYSTGGDDPLERLATGFADIENCSVLLLERAVVPVRQYVELWSEDPVEQRDWINGFSERGIAHIGTGIVAVHRNDGAEQAVSMARYNTGRRQDVRVVIRDWVGTHI